MYNVLKEMAHVHASKKKRHDGENAEILNKVSARVITNETLRDKLAQHVEQVMTSRVLLVPNLKL